MALSRAPLMTVDPTGTSTWCFMPLYSIFVIFGIRLPLLRSSGFSYNSGNFNANIVSCGSLPKP
jgi:hypothetical protein